MKKFLHKVIEKIKKKDNFIYIATLLWGIFCLYYYITRDYLIMCLLSIVIIVLSLYLFFESE